MRKTALVTVMLLIAVTAVLGTSWADPPDSEEPESKEGAPESLPPGTLQPPDQQLRIQQLPIPRPLPPRPPIRTCFAQTDSEECAVGRAISRMNPCLKRDGCQAYETWIGLYGQPQLLPARPPSVPEPVLVSNPPPEDDE